jgi:hypothetical protein
VEKSPSQSDKERDNDDYNDCMQIEVSLVWPAMLKMKVAMLFYTEMLVMKKMSQRMTVTKTW